MLIAKSSYHALTLPKISINGPTCIFEQLTILFKLF